MAATIKIKNSSTASAVPTSSDLVQGELAVNVTDKRIFTENASGTVVELGTNPSILTLPDGSASAPTLTNDGDTNTGIFFPAADTVGITTGGTERARVDSSGNLGLGVTPSAWGSGWRALQFGGGGSAFTNGTTDARIGANTYYTGSTFAAISTGAASRYEQVAGVHYWLNAASVSAGTSQTFTQAMTLDASGNLGVGTTSPGNRLQVVGATGPVANFVGNNANNFITVSDNNNTDTISVGAIGGGNAYLYSGSGKYTALYAGATERARIDSSGNLLVGTTSNYGKLTVYDTQSTNATNSFMVRNGGGGNESLYCRSDGYVSMPWTYSYATSAAGANMVIGSGGFIYRSTSALKYKTDIRDLENVDLNSLRPVRYKSLCNNDDANKDFIGFVADEAADNGWEELVSRNDSGDVEGFQYERVTALLWKKAQEQQALIAQLQADVAALKG